jgi:hypothetical protein
MFEEGNTSIALPCGWKQSSDCRYAADALSICCLLSSPKLFGCVAVCIKLDEASA